MMKTDLAALTYDELHTLRDQGHDEARRLAHTAIDIEAVQQEIYRRDQAALDATFEITERTVVEVDGEKFLVVDGDWSNGDHGSFAFRGVPENPNIGQCLTAFVPVRRKVFAAYRAIKGAV